MHRSRLDSVSDRLAVLIKRCVTLNVNHREILINKKFNNVSCVILQYSNISQTKGFYNKKNWCQNFKTFSSMKTPNSQRPQQNSRLHMVIRYLIDLILRPKARKKLKSQQVFCICENDQTLTFLRKKKKICTYQPRKTVTWVPF